MSTTAGWRAGGLFVVACLALACARDSDRFDAAVEPPPLVRTAAQPRDVWEYALDAASRAEFVVVGHQRRIVGELPLASGRLWVDGGDLDATRASLTFDLAGIRLEAAGATSAEPGVAKAGHTSAISTLTEQSLEWLQLARPADLESHPELRFARFTLLGIGALESRGSASSRVLDPTPALASASSPVASRRLRVRASGELELHGYRLPQTASMLVTFEWAAPAEAGAPPRRIRLETAEPLGIDLLAHGIVPRDSQGEVLADGLAELRKLRSNPVQVSLRWVAELVASASARATDGAGPAARDP